MTWYCRVHGITNTILQVTVIFPMNDSVTKTNLAYHMEARREHLGKEKSEISRKRANKLVVTEGRMKG